MTWQPFEALNVARIAELVPSAGHSSIVKEPLEFEKTKVLLLDSCTRDTSCELYEGGIAVIQSEMELEFPVFMFQSPVVKPARRYGPKRIACREAYSGRSSARVINQVLS